MSRRGWDASRLNAVLALSAIGIVAVSLASALSHKSPSPFGATIGDTLQAFDKRSSPTADLWAASASTMDASVVAEELVERSDESDDSRILWTATRATYALVGERHGKLVIARQFGEADEIDPADILADPYRHMTRITIGFFPFSHGEASWVWARYAPDGTPEFSLDPEPLPTQLAAAANAHCVAPALESASTKG